jgi:hypothetical protein
MANNWYMCGLLTLRRYIFCIDKCRHQKMRQNVTRVLLQSSFSGISSHHLQFHLITNFVIYLPWLLVRKKGLGNVFISIENQHLCLRFNEAFMMFVFIIYHLNYRQIQAINQTAKSGSIIFPRALLHLPHAVWGIKN